jgi:hypothetical protein
MLTRIFILFIIFLLFAKYFKLFYWAAKEMIYKAHSWLLVAPLHLHLRVRRNRIENEFLNSPTKGFWILLHFFILLTLSIWFNFFIVRIVFKIAINYISIVLDCCSIRRQCFVVCLLYSFGFGAVANTFLNLALNVNCNFFVNKFCYPSILSEHANNSLL